jgi:hypothetical protein
MLRANGFSQLRPGLHRIDHLLDHFHPGEVGSKQRNHVDVRRHLLDAREDSALAQAMLADISRQFLRRPPRNQPRHLDAPHMPQRAQLKRRNKPAAHNPIAQRSHADPRKREF